MALLEVQKLSVSYRSSSGWMRAVRDFSLAIEPGDSVALAGETGSGKSTVALALLGLIDGNGQVDSGSLQFEGTRIAWEDRRTWRRVRGKKIGMVFQDARGALNPVLTVGFQMTEALRAHRRLGMKEAREISVRMLADAGIPDSTFYMNRYPGELSGGMCQRVAIAMAVCNQPKLLIADEPTSALDPSIQVQILELLRGMKQRFGMALLLISHDLALISEVAERVEVMYHGRLVESGATLDVFHRPGHPYTSSLLECQAGLHHRWDTHPLVAIAGGPPPGTAEFPGCAFAPRCPRADSHCTRAVPPALPISPSHSAACLYPAR